MKLLKKDLEDKPIEQEACDRIQQENVKQVREEAEDLQSVLDSAIKPYDSRVVQPDTILEAAREEEDKSDFFNKSAEKGVTQSA
jgi:hypothetical protein